MLVTHHRGDVDGRCHGSKASGVFVRGVVAVLKCRNGRVAFWNQRRRLRTSGGGGGSSSARLPILMPLHSSKLSLNMDVLYRTGSLGSVSSKGTLYGKDSNASSYDSSKTFSQNVELTDPIISRFDILCVVKDVIDPVTDEMLAQFVVDSHFRSQSKGAINMDDKAFIESQEETRASAGLADSKILSQELLRKYLTYVKLNIFTRFHEKDMAKLVLARESLRGNELGVSLQLSGSWKGPSTSNCWRHIFFSIEGANFHSSKALRKFSLLLGSRHFCFHPSFHLFLRRPPTFIIAIRCPPSTVRLPPPTASLRHPFAAVFPQEDRFPTLIPLSRLDFQGHLFGVALNALVFRFTPEFITNTSSFLWARLILANKTLVFYFPDSWSFYLFFMWDAGIPPSLQQNLLRWLPGFEDSQLSYKGEKPKGFVLFSNAEFAVAAKDVLQKMVFDSKLKSLLHIEMARKNLVVKRGIITDSDALDKYGRFPVPPVLPLPNTACVASPSIYVPVKTECCDEKSAVDGVHEGTRESTTKEYSIDKSGCYTLFVENLPEKIHWKRFGSLICSHGQVLDAFFL
ncbi:hypothetical protein F3Y22_tig00112293pilonHSYRG00235 [Hibiscus syriacus]|uniref:MCM C-terminal AAA(+) ATPase domain-containing protein n=1 Tax=Hibiscus syriacus TaxID=106335 RepID=A0A6A2X1J1_HIBSY|nr:hypothetical protein F3Y22_tig00112293pilonHSYRG00235 [Hibiscus syriacus]